MSSSGEHQVEKPLFGVVGLERGAGISGFMHVERDARPQRVVMRSRSVGFKGANGTTISVTTHPNSDNRNYESLRSSAPMSLYRTTPQGRTTLGAPSDPTAAPEPVDAPWEPVAILVASRLTPFEKCEFIDSWWVAIGRLPGAVITLDSRGIPFSEVRLEEIDEHPVPDLPEMGTETSAVIAHLDDRFVQIPFRRVRNRADYWALYAIEADHAHRLGNLYNLDEETTRGLETHWLARIERELSSTSERLRYQGIESMRNSRIARRLRGHDFLLQLWSNTVGPGARCWIGNRYGPIRRHTLRLYWRP